MWESQFACKYGPALKGLHTILVILLPLLRLNLQRKMKIPTLVQTM